MIFCTETSVRKYHSKLCNNPEERVSHLLYEGILKSHKSINHSLVLSLCKRLWMESLGILVYEF